MHSRISRYFYHEISILVMNFSLNCYRTVAYWQVANLNVIWKKNDNIKTTLILNFCPVENRILLLDFFNVGFYKFFPKNISSLSKIFHKLWKHTLNPGFDVPHPAPTSPHPKNITIIFKRFVMFWTTIIFSHFLKT